MASEGADDARLDPGRAAEILGDVRVRLDELRTRSLEAVAEQAGLEPETLRRLFAAAGRLHDDGRYGARDEAYARDAAHLLERFDAEVLERAFRLNQRAVTQIAVNQLALVQADRRLAPLLEHASSDERLTGWLTREARETLSTVQRLLLEDHQERVLRLLDSQVVAQASQSLGRVLDVAVAFVDLVGFTRLSASVEPDEVSDTLSAFEDLVHAAAAEAGEVMVVKFIGDAAMLLGARVDEVAQAALAIVEAEDPGLESAARRAGLAAGQVQVRDGDYVGTPVNVAARLTDLARPASLVVAEDVVERLERPWRTSRLPSLRIKGLGRSRPVRLREPEPDGG